MICCIPLYASDLAITVLVTKLYCTPEFCGVFDETSWGSYWCPSLVSSKHCKILYYSSLLSNDECNRQIWYAPNPYAYVCTIVPITSTTYFYGQTNWPKSILCLQELIFHAVQINFQCRKRVPGLLACAISVQWSCWPRQTSAVISGVSSSVELQLQFLSKIKWLKLRMTAELE